MKEAHDATYEPPSAPAGWALVQRRGVAAHAAQKELAALAGQPCPECGQIITKETVHA